MSQATTERALENCYAFARREVWLLKRKKDSGREVLLDTVITGWEHVIRFCEEAGLKPNILRSAADPLVDEG